MAEYIEREALQEIFENRMQDNNMMCPVIKVLDVIEIIEKQPTADVEPVEHGKWLPQYVSSRGLTDIFACSVCNGSTHTIHKYDKCPDKYCKHCGARMDEEGVNNDV